MLNFQQIIEDKIIEVENLKQRLKTQGATTVIRPHENVRSFKNILSENQFTIIPELKKADPWRGLFRENYDVEEITLSLHKAGAKAIAVTVDNKYFMGEKEHLYLASKNTDMPVIMRDFIIDEAQLTDAKSQGANAVVLMPALVDEKKFKSLVNFARYIMLEVAVEINSLGDLDMALNVDVDVIGILNRNIESQELLVELGNELRSKIPENILTYSVGGCKTAENLKTIVNAGFNGVLVGEKLMKSENPAEIFSLLTSEI